MTPTRAASPRTVTITVTHSGSPTDADGTLSGIGLNKTGTGTLSDYGRLDSRGDRHAGRADLHNRPRIRVVPGGTIVTGFTLAVTDTLTASATDTATTVVATAVNDTPAITGTAAGQTVNDDATLNPFPACWCQRPPTPVRARPVTIVLTNGGSATDADGTLSGVGLRQDRYPASIR